MIPKKILYIEDNAENRFLVREILQIAGYTVIEAEEGSSGILKAISERPDLVLVDIMMPGFDGREVATYLRGIPSLEKVPIVALSASVLKGERESALAAGCNGYLQKPVDVVQLPKQIEGFLQGQQESLSAEEELHYLRKHTRHLAERLNQKIQQLSGTHETNRRLMDQAWIDESTGLPNHRYLHWKIRNDLEVAKRFGTPLSCIMANLDNLEQVSQRSSYPVEAALSLISKIFTVNKRMYDVMGRYGRSKLLLAFPVDGQNGIAIAERIRHKVEAGKVMAGGDKSIKVTISLGVAEWRKDRFISEKDLIRCADEALDQAGEAGGNRTVMYGEE